MSHNDKVLLISACAAFFVSGFAFAMALCGGRNGS